jgi:UDP-glucuronate 4-epimerase
MKILVTGAAGFIGCHLAKHLAEEKHEIVCIDNINSYYDTALKYGRLACLGFSPCRGEDAVEEVIVSSRYPNARFAKIDLRDKERLTALFREENFDAAAHLAAQAGVRYSITHPDEYISNNIQGFLNILEACRLFPPRHLVYASSSSVYGLNAKIPFSENDSVSQPVSLYAASKRANELMAYTYSRLYAIRATALRFFTVYGPWGRPDMAPFIFVKSILEGKPIQVFNNGNMKRDFTFIDDIIEGIKRVLFLAPDDAAAARIYNIGNGTPVALMDFIHTLEDVLGKKAVINYTGMQPGDVPATWADCSALLRDTGFKPQTALARGIQEFVAWYKEFYAAEENIHG